MKIRVTAPLRVDIGGGITDIPQISDEIGTAVLNLAVDLYNDSDHLSPADVSVEVSENTQGQNRLFFNGKLRSLDIAPGDNLYLIKAIIRSHLKHSPETNSLDISVTNTLPPGTGLGGSAVLTLCLLSALRYAQEGGIARPDTDVILEAHHFETIELGIKGGFQDYIAAYFGNCNYIDFTSLHDAELTNMPTLGATLPAEVEEFFNQSMLVVILNLGNISSSDIVADELARFYSNKADTTDHLVAIKNHNVKLYDVLHQAHLCSSLADAIGQEINQSWAHQKKLSQLIGQGLLKEIEENVRPMTHGLRGPGAAANSLFLLTKPDQRSDVLEYLRSHGDEVSVFFPLINKTGLRVDKITQN